MSNRYEYDTLIYRPGSSAKNLVRHVQAKHDGLGAFIGSFLAYLATGVTLSAIFAPSAGDAVALSLGALFASLLLGLGTGLGWGELYEPRVSRQIKRENVIVVPSDLVRLSDRVAAAADVTLDPGFYQRHYHEFIQLIEADGEMDHELTDDPTRKRIRAHIERRLEGLIAVELEAALATGAGVIKSAKLHNAALQAKYQPDPLTELND
jgi:hypothetical protein